MTVKQAQIYFYFSSPDRSEIFRTQELGSLLRGQGKSYLDRMPSRDTNYCSDPIAIYVALTRFDRCKYWYQA